MRPHSRNLKLHTKTQFRFLVNGPEKTGTHLLVRLMNRFGLTHRNEGLSSFITEDPHDTFGMSKEEFSRGKRVRIWGWPLEGLPEGLVRERLAHLEAGCFTHSHAPYSSELCGIFEDLNYRVFQTIRDPRDQVQSMADWYSNERAPDNRRRRELGPLPYVDRLRIAITGSRLSDGASVLGVNEYYGVMAGWLSQPIVRAVRFEDLVGPKGDGSLERQIKEIDACAEFANVPLGDAAAEKIAHLLFGFGGTFRAGKIGTWRKVFTPEIRQLFKDHSNQLLLQLGYETSADWE